MTTTIASGIHTTTPSLVKSWESTQPTRNVVHHIIGRSDPDITLKPAGKRTGTLQLFYTTKTAAEAARELFALPLVFVTDSTDETWLDGFRFVSSGNISAVLDADNFTTWHISVDFQEVLG
jgi:hypothetical protein